MIGRKFLYFCPISVSLALFGCGGGSSSLGPSGNQAATAQGVYETVSGLRLFRDVSTHMVAAALVTNSNPNITFNDSNLYYRIHVAPGRTTVDYFSDAAATRGVGDTVLTGNNNGTFPLSMTVNTNVTGGRYPGNGSLNLLIPAGGTQNFSLNGQFTELNRGPYGVLTFTFGLASHNGLLSGSLSATNGSQTVSLTNITESQNGSDTVIQGTLGVQPPGISEGFTLILHSDGSDTLELADGTAVTIDKAGAGRITFPDGVSLDLPFVYVGV